MTLHVAYLVNQYPKVSHTFIRREIFALERRGVRVERFALRGWDADVADPDDLAERARCRHVLRRHPAGLALEAAWRLLSRPVRAWRALRRLRPVARGDRRWRPRWICLAEACRVARWMEQTGAQHLHAHFGTNSAEVAMVAALLCGRPFSFTVHGPEEFDRPGALALGAKVEAAAFAVAISAYGRSQLCRWVGAAHWPRIVTVRCGLEPAFFELPAALDVADVPRLVCVGRLCDQKGQLLLLQALVRLRAWGLVPELVLAGDGERRALIERAAAEAGLASQLRVTGWLGSDEVRREILGARALVLPSFAEGLPVVLMEAMACGRPVVSSCIAGIPELVRDGVEGWLVPPGDVEALAGALRDCLQAGPGQLARMGRAGRARVAALHDIDEQARRLAARFEQSVAEGTWSRSDRRAFR